MATQFVEVLVIIIIKIARIIAKTGISIGGGKRGGEGRGGGGRRVEETGRRMRQNRVFLRWFLPHCYLSCKFDVKRLMYGEIETNVNGGPSSSRLIQCLLRGPKSLK